jgi:hypothetical protein
MGWTFYNSSGQKLSTASTLIDNLDIDGATDIGAAIVDADLFIIDDGAGGTNRKTAASRLKTYIGGLKGTIWVQPHAIDGTATLAVPGFGDAGRWSGASIGSASADGKAFFVLPIPSDFSTLTKAVAVVIGVQSANMMYEVLTNWGATGEQSDANTDAAAGGMITEGLTADTIEELDIISAFTGIAASDTLALQFTRDGSQGGDTMTTVYILGILLEYT